jgi:hypothetical protein
MLQCALLALQSCATTGGTRSTIHDRQQQTLNVQNITNKRQSGKLDVFAGSCGYRVCTRDQSSSTDTAEVLLQLYWHNSASKSTLATGIWCTLYEQNCSLYRASVHIHYTNLISIASCWRCCCCVWTITVCIHVYCNHCCCYAATDTA